MLISILVQKITFSVKMEFRFFVRMLGFIIHTEWYGVDYVTIRLLVQIVRDCFAVQCFVFLLVNFKITFSVKRNFDFLCGCLVLLPR